MQSCCSGEEQLLITSGEQVVVLRLSKHRSSSSHDQEGGSRGGETVTSRLQQINEARIGLQFLHPNIVHVYAYAARLINLDTIMAKVCMLVCGYPGLAVTCCPV